jgi:hypothetical protein
MQLTSSLMNNATGKFGNMVFLPNSGCIRARAWVVPSNPQSSYQTAVRGEFATLAAYWSGTLTQAQRTAWAAWAATVSYATKLGTTYTPSGFNAFMAANTARVQAGLAVVAAGPTTSGAASFTTPVITWDASSHTISVAFEATDDWNGEVGGALILRTGVLPFLPGVTFWEGPVRYASKQLGAASPPAGPLVFDLGVGNVVADIQYGCALRAVRTDGRYSPERFFRGIAVA